MQTRRMVLALALGLVVSCGSKKEGGGGGGGGAVTWPAKPADGTPVVFEFLALEGTGDKMEAKVRMFNFTDKKVVAIQSKLDYLDASGNKLKDFPWGMSAPSLIDAKGHKEDEIGAFIPPETKKVVVNVSGVTFGDGSKWP